MVSRILTPFHSFPTPVFSLNPLLLDIGLLSIFKTLQPLEVHSVAWVTSDPGMLFLQLGTWLMSYCLGLSSLSPHQKVSLDKQSKVTKWSLPLNMTLFSFIFLPFFYFTILIDLLSISYPNFILPNQDVSFTSVEILLVFTLGLLHMEQGLKHKSSQIIV